MKYEEVSVGEVYVHKTTGSYLVVMRKGAEPSQAITVRMAAGPLDHNAQYVAVDFLPEELETVEGHLRRNLAELEFKQALLEEAKARQIKASKVTPASDLVN